MLKIPLTLPICLPKTLSGFIANLPLKSSSSNPILVPNEVIRVLIPVLTEAILVFHDFFISSIKSVNDAGVKALV